MTAHTATAARPDRPSATACAIPADCRLWAAAQPSDIRVGLATGGRGPQQEAVIASEANVVVDHQLSWVGIEPDG